MKNEKEQTLELLTWYRSRVGIDGSFVITALSEAVEYIHSMMSRSVPQGLEAAHCFNTIRATLVQGKDGIEKETAVREAFKGDEVTDDEARKILREFFDSIASLDSSMRNLANVIKNKQLF